MTTNSTSLENLICAFGTRRDAIAKALYWVGRPGGGWSVHVPRPGLGSGYTVTHGDDLLDTLCRALAGEGEPETEYLDRVAPIKGKARQRPDPVPDWSDVI